MAPLFSTLFLIQNKWSQERTGWRGGGRAGEGKRQIKEKKSRALSPWPSIRSLKKRERGRKEGLWANSSSPLLQSISGQKKYTITRQEEAKIYGPETSPLTSNHLTPFCSSRSLSLSLNSLSSPLLPSIHPPQHLQWCTVSADCFTSTLALFNEISKSFNRCIWSTRRETPTYSSTLLCCKVHFGSDVLMHENVNVTLLRRLRRK